MARMNLPFDNRDAILLNHARAEHLFHLNLPIERHDPILEVGCGIGFLTPTLYCLSKYVTSTDGRIENVEENIRRHPQRKDQVSQMDVLDFDRMEFELGYFPITFCYGLLYHLGDPELCISNLAELTTRMMILSSWVSKEDNGEINPCEEDNNVCDVSITGAACRPARDWIMDALRRHFEYAYATVNQPRHGDYPIQWPPPPWRRRNRTRAVFVASHLELNLDTLTETLPEVQNNVW